MGRRVGPARRPRRRPRHTSVRCKPERSCYYWAHCSSHESPIQCLFKCSRLGVTYVKNLQLFERKTDANISCGLDQRSTVSARPTKVHPDGLRTPTFGAVVTPLTLVKVTNYKEFGAKYTRTIKREKGESNVFEQGSRSIARRTVSTTTRRRISDGLSPIGANYIRALSLHCY